MVGSKSQKSSNKSNFGGSKHGPKNSKDISYKSNSYESSGKSPSNEDAVSPASEVNPSPK
jgi:hypothetical protein